MQSTTNSVPQTSTGPRTAAGKKRSRRNALKHGIFSKHLILDGERCVDFEKLHEGLREHWQPEGIMEELNVYDLAGLYWRAHRIILAESALIARSPAFVGVGRPNPDLPSPYLLRAPLKDGSTPLSARTIILERALEQLLKLSKDIAARGLHFGKDFVTIAGMYCNFDSHSSSDFCAEMSGLMIESLKCEKGHDTNLEHEVRKQAMRLIRNETDRLVKLGKKNELNEGIWNSHASLLPSQADLDRIVRYESHLSREIERNINLLERLQRARRGCPPPPTIKVDLG